MALPSRDAARDEVLFCSSLAHSAVNYRGDFQDGRQPISSALQSVPGHNRFSSTERLLKVNKSPDWMTHSVKIKQLTGWFHEPSHRMNIAKLHRAEEIKNSVWNMNTRVQVVNSSSSVVLLTRVKPWKSISELGHGLRMSGCTGFCVWFVSHMCRIPPEGNSTQHVRAPYVLINAKCHQRWVISLQPGLLGLLHC